MAWAWEDCRTDDPRALDDPGICGYTGASCNLAGAYVAATYDDAGEAVRLSREKAGVCIDLQLPMIDGDWQLAAYLVDFDQGGRSQTMRLRDSSGVEIPGSLVNVSNFENGVYVKWSHLDLTADNQVTLEAVADPGSVNTVISGIFLDRIDGMNCEDQPEPLMDHGDAPDSYGTLEASNGPTHELTNNLKLGTGVDEEDDGLPTPGADGDDLDNQADEDGVNPASLMFVEGDDATVPVSVTNPTDRMATLKCWMDLDGNGLFDEPGESVSQPIAAGYTGTVSLDFGTVPDNGVTDTYLRCRIGTDDTSVEYPTGPAPDGEVEDYPVTVAPAPVYDHGDAPDSYGTLEAGDGPTHELGSGLVLGTLIDDEADGLPGPDADGDDTDGDADEDGVSPASLMFVEDDNATVTVTVSNPTGVDAYLKCWIDFDGSGQFDEPGESVSDTVPPASTTAWTWISAACPTTASPTPTCAAASAPTRRASPGPRASPPTARSRTTRSRLSRPRSTTTAMPPTATAPTRAATAPSTSWAAAWSWAARWTTSSTASPVPVPTATTPTTAPTRTASTPPTWT
jgi:hypothetical protein